MINDKDEWGNVELPGINDETLFNPRLSTILRNKGTKQREATSKSNQKRKGENHPLHGIKGENSHRFGQKHREEDKSKMVHYGKDNGMYGKGHLVSQEKNGFFHKNHTKETVENLREAALNREKDHYCKYCNGNFTAQAYKQHHGDYCSQNSNRIVKERKLMSKTICPHCSKEAAPKAFARLHGDNCKKKPK